MTETQPPVHGQSLARREASLAYVALVALGVVAALAFIPQSTALADRVVLLPLGVVAAILFWTPLLRADFLRGDGATFALTAAMFVVYGLARQAEPVDGFSLRFAALPDDRFTLPYSAYVAVAGAIVTSPFWWRHRSDWINALLGGMVLIAGLTAGIFGLLVQHYPVGPTEILDPIALPPLAMQLIEYSCLALLCHAVSSHAGTRLIALRILPLFLLVLWARHQFLIPAEDAE